MFDANLARHHELIEEARGRGAGLVVFPELGLTGYLLQDLAAEVAIRLDDPRLAGLAAETKDLSVVVSFVEESGDHRLFIAAALLEDGRVRHVHRKLFLPTYGLFADLRRERLRLPLLRDERPELQVRELTRIVAERAGLASDTTADELAEAGLDIAPGDPVHAPIGFREDPVTPTLGARGSPPDRSS